MLEHSYKGTTWKNHKYIRKEDGRYYYPSRNTAGDDYKNRTLRGQSENASKGLQRDVQSIEKEVKKDERRKERVRISLQRERELRQRETEKKKRRGERIIQSVMKRIGNSMMSKASSK